jgi:hypothetical protein
MGSQQVSQMIDLNHWWKQQYPTVRPIWRKKTPVSQPANQTASCLPLPLRTSGIEAVSVAQRIRQYFMQNPYSALTL